MKIHIVQKGDTFWEIAKKYGMDIEQLKQLNPQIASPDMIMPGMKIKIISSSKPVKKESVSIKETKTPIVKEAEKPIAKEVPKEIPQKPLQVIKEDDHQKPKEVKVEMPFKHMPQLPQKVTAPKVEKPIKKPIQKEAKKPMKEMMQMPVLEESLQINLSEIPKKSPQTEMKPVMENIECENHQQMSTIPMYQHHCHQCCPPIHHHYFPVTHMQEQMHMPMGQMPMGFIPQGHMMNHNMPPQQHPGHMAHHQMPLQQQHLMNSSDCGCQTMMPPQQHFMRDQAPPIPVPFPPMDLEQVHYQENSKEQQMQRNLNELPTYPPNFTNDPVHSIRNTYPTPPGYPSFSEFKNEEDADKPKSE